MARRRINLALQGGGAHGAFTWGVLDRLLDEDGLGFEGISGTSAGAMNAAIMAQGWMEGEREGARAALDGFWRAVSESAPFSPIQRTPWDRLTGNFNTDASPGYLWLDNLFRMLSPYQFNPGNLNPLRELLEKTISIPKVRACKGLKLFIATTNVQSGKIRIFDNDTLSVDAILASACLPMMFQSVMIEGEPYWDGGYMGNPAIFPLIYRCESADVLIVQINPLTREGVPKTAAEIVNRLNEITFNSSLMREMRAISFATKLIEDEHVTGPRIERLKKMLIHMIYPGETMKALGVSSKLNPELDFLLELKRFGRERAEAWLAAHSSALGRRSTVDVESIYQ